MNPLRTWFLSAPALRAALAGRRIRLALSTALMLTLVLQPSVSHAAAFTVNSTADAVDVHPGDGICATAAGVCTLRAAIQETNALPGPDTINLPAGTYTLTIENQGDDAAATGSLDILDHLTIAGAGSATTVIDGNGSVTRDRVFQILPGFTHAGFLVPSVRISGVTITGGAALDSHAPDGGGVYTKGSLTLDDVLIRQNIAGNEGGGIFSGYFLALNNSSVSDNSALYGGGIYSQVDLTLNQTTISGNTARALGGGAVTGFNTTMQRSTISGNSAGNLGGGILNEGVLTLNRTTISENRVTGASGEGGGVFNLRTLEANDSVVRGNTAVSGAGIRSMGPLTINRSTITGNSARFEGGGIRQWPLGDNMEINDSTIQGNTAGMGAGIQLIGANGTLRRSTVSSNTAQFGGGVASLSDQTFTPAHSSTLNVERSTLSGNVGSVFGGGFYNYQSTLALTNSTISGNGAPQGGGLYNDGSATISSSTFMGSSAPPGGGIFNLPGRTVSLLNTIVANSPSGGNCSGAITSSGHNLSSDASCTFAGPGDLNSTNPNLGPLADNGGPTQTHALLPGSPAIDAGSNAGCPSTDQRGVSRPADGNNDGSAICDIGAYELPAAPTPKTRVASVVGSGSVDTGDPSLGLMDFTVSASRALVGGEITGSLTKMVRSNGRGIRSTEITELVVLSTDRVLVKGSCVKTPTGEPCTFTADIADGGPGGSGDVFTIATDDGPQLGGRLLSGDVTIQTP